MKSIVVTMDNLFFNYSEIDIFTYLHFWKIKGVS